jgi:hypothetical protein
LRFAIYVAEVASRRRAPTGYRFVPDCGVDKEAFPSVMRKIIEAARLSPGFDKCAAKQALVRGAKPLHGKEIPSPEIG